MLGKLGAKLVLLDSLLVIISGILPLFLTALPFCSPDSCPLIPTSSTFVSHGRSAELIPYFLSKVWQPAAESNAIFALPLGIAVLFLLIKRLVVSSNLAKDIFSPC